jgi:hypothetical protein
MMIIPVNYTLEQAQNATKAQIVTAITNKLNSYTKRQILTWLMEEVEFSDSPTVTTNPNGEISSQDEITRDIETNAPTHRRHVDWTYYPTGEVDIITISEFDENDALISEKKIKHYKDKKAPEVL